MEAYLSNKYMMYDSIIRSELWYRCKACGWEDAESCLLWEGDDAVEYRPSENRVVHVADGCGGNVQFV
jgi:hypothetical protein